MVNNFLMVARGTQPTSYITRTKYLIFLKVIRNAKELMIINANESSYFEIEWLLLKVRNIRAVNHRFR